MPEDMEAVSQFIHELDRESDRGLALIGAAFIDERLAAILQAFFFREAPGLLLGKNAPLGTFSARIQTCHSLALIEDGERHDCDLIRRIRNEFAHEVVSTSFDKGRVFDLCGNLKAELPEPDLAATTPARFKFQNAVVNMVMRLHHRPEAVQQEKRKQKRWIDPELIKWHRIDEAPPPEGRYAVGVKAPGYKPPRS